ncbi:MAG: alanine--tRNA ligase [Desulfatiglandales bacterium]
MDFREIRQMFFDFFTARGHEKVDSASLIPRDDPSLLFTNAGMVQFKSLFLGDEKRPYTRAVTSQKCARAGGKHNDLENVGHTARHHTFFEMLGNFSFGDYFKEEAISWGWELLTEGYNVPKDKLYVSVYKDDDEAYQIWHKKIGLSPDRIVRLGEKDNFWAMGDTGPCGPCSEILIDQGESVGCGRPDCGPGCDCDRFLEIWNLVFMQFNRDAQGRLHPLPRPSIDTGMGLERLAAVVQGVKSNYDTDLFKGIIRGIEEISGYRYGGGNSQDVSFRVIADHSRAAAFLIGDGVMPSNEGRGYVLRRIIRRAIRFGQVLGIHDPFLHRMAAQVIEFMGGDFQELVTSRSFIEGVVKSEEKRFADTLHYGMNVLREEMDVLRGKGRDTISGEVAFKLYDTYGLSVDILQDVAREEGLKVDVEGYEGAMTRQRRQSQESWKGSGEEEIPEAYRRLTSEGLGSRFLGYEKLDSGARVMAILKAGEEVQSAGEGEEIDVLLDSTPFYGEAGGQVGDQGWILGESMRMEIRATLKFGRDLIVHQGKIIEGVMSSGDSVTAVVDEERRKATARNHTATHLLHAALREILGDHVKQAGSSVSPERLRFDFSHFAQVDQEKLQEVEGIVNRHIWNNHPLSTTVMDREEAMGTGAMAIFEERYGKRVRLVQVGDGVSKELCGGTHTSRTGDIGLFKIVAESAVGANLRRIEALTGQMALDCVQSQERDLKAVSSLLKSAPDQIIDRTERLLRHQKALEREIEGLKSRILSFQSGDLLAGARQVSGFQVLAKEVEAVSPKELREFSDRVKEKLSSGIVVLGAKKDDKALLICLVTQDLQDRYKAGQIISRLSEMVGGKGGGRPDMAQGGGSRPENLRKALESVPDIIASLSQ